MADGMEGYTEDEAPSTQGERPLTEESTPEDSGQTLHVPAAFLEGATLKEGDELVLKVVSADDEGLEVAYAKAPRSAEGEGSANSELDSLGNSEDY